MVKINPKSPLALNNRKQGRRSKQNRIFWLRPPVKVAKGHPKSSPKTFRGRLQPLENASKAPPRRVLEVGNLENLIFEGCTVRNHKFWKCQGAPRSHQKQSKLVSKPSLGSFWDEEKCTQKLAQDKNRFLRRIPFGRFQLSGPGPWKWDHNYI